jgi:hypothetical protein
MTGITNISAQSIFPLYNFPGLWRSLDSLVGGNMARAITRAYTGSKAKPQPQK